jgi:hypothetical protein
MYVQISNMFLTEVVSAKAWRWVLWIGLILGLIINAWAFWLIASEVAKDMWRFGGFPRDAVHIGLGKKLTFGFLQLALLGMIWYLFQRNKVALLILSLVVLGNLCLIFGPAVGTLKSTKSHLIKSDVIKPTAQYYAGNCH